MTGYAQLGELRMYYEVHGEGRPLVLLHGAYFTVDLMGPIVGALAKTRQVNGRRHRAPARDPSPAARPQARRRVGRLPRRRHAGRGARDVPLDLPRDVRRLADR